MGKKTVYPSIRIYLDKIQNRITFKRVLYTFVPNKSFGQLLDISLENFIFLKTFNSEFLYIEVYRNSNPLEIEDKINITLVISSVQPRDRLFVKGYDFCHLL